MPPSTVDRELLRAAETLRDEVEALRFSAPVSHVYNPLAYAWEPFANYNRRFAQNRKRVVFLGMNPGPFGMMQTGVPFGEIAAVRDWMKVSGVVGKPRLEHPRRPITGFACTRSEVSGKRLWGLFAERFRTPERFFTAHFVVNYCPLVFLEESGRNFTPDKLSASEKTALQASCDKHLHSVLNALRPEWVIAVGDFAFRRATDVAGNGTSRIGRILHPSPASPAANRDWAGMAQKQLRELGVWD